MAETTFDTIAATLTLLKQNSALVTACTDSKSFVWIAFAPMPQGSNSTGYKQTDAVLITSVADDTNDRAGIKRVQAEIRCYGEHSWDVMALYEKLYTALQHKQGIEVTMPSGQKATLGFCRKTGGPTPRQEPEMGWLYAETSWTMTWATKLVAGD